MRNLIVTAAEAAELIASGATMLVAGPERALAALPYGRWIGTATEHPAESEDNPGAERLSCTILASEHEARITVVAAGMRPIRPEGAVCHLLTPGALPRRLSDTAPDLAAVAAPGGPFGAAARVFDGRSGMSFTDLSLALTVPAPAGLPAVAAKPAQRRPRAPVVVNRRVVSFRGTGPARPAAGRSPIAVMKPEE